MDELSGRADRPANVASIESDRRVAVAVDAQEARWFLEGARVPDAFSLLGLECKCAESRLREIMELDPEVLLTCWSTPHLPDAWLRSCRLRYVCHLTGSVRHIVPRSFIERGGVVTNWGSIPARTVAEQALLLALAALRNAGRWEEVFDSPSETSDRMERLHTRSLYGRRVGIHGFGQVARALVKLLAPFGAHVSVFAPGVPAEVLSEAKTTPVRSLPGLFAGSEVVFECEALNASTRDSVQVAELAALPSGAVFVNVARAGLVNEAALLREAAAGRIRVALDVFAVEPLPLDSPWRSIPGVVMSPHIAGPTFDQYADCTRAAFANLRRYFAGQPLDSLITLEIYHRST